MTLSMHWNDFLMLTASQNPFKSFTHMHVNKKLEKHTENIDILFTRL